MKRDAGLDVIRVVAVVLIVTFHFCAELGYTDSPFCRYANGGWGSVGTTMFFVLSGYVLRLCHKEVPQLGRFYKKRFLSIYPMFWITFAVGYVLHSAALGNFRYGGEWWRMVFSFLGIDNYLVFYEVQTYAVVGEWFTAVIVALYLLYPLLNRVFERWMVPATFVLFGLYMGNIASGIFRITPDANLITGVFLFWVGMLLERYGAAIRERAVLLVPFLGLIFLIVFVKLPFYSLPWKNLLGVSIFVVLLILCRNVGRNSFAAGAAMFFSEISYAIYLCHHFILKALASRYGSLLVSNKRIVFFYGINWLVILVVSLGLYYVTGIVLRSRRPLFSR